MFRRCFVLVSLLLLSACGAVQICPQRHAVVRQPAMSCAELNQVTAATLKRLGYNIDSFVPATNEQHGKAEGRKRDEYDSTYTISVELQCSASEAVADAVSSVGCAGQISFPNEFQTSFTTSMAKKIERPSLVPKDEQVGLRIEVEPQRDGDKAVGVPLTRAELMPVKVTINNRTARAYRLEADGIVLVSQSGAQVTGMSPAEAAKRVAKTLPPDAGNIEGRLQEKHLHPGPIDADEKVEGYVYVPRQAYRRATVKLVDAEADEPEGFTVEF